MPFCSHNLKHSDGIFIFTKKGANPSISLAKLWKEKKSILFGKYALERYTTPKNCLNQKYQNKGMD